MSPFCFNLLLTHVDEPLCDHVDGYRNNIISIMKVNRETVCLFGQ